MGLWQQPAFPDRIHGACHSFPNRRMPGPRRIQPQDGLRHACGRAGRRGRRPRHTLGIRFGPVDELKHHLRHHSHYLGRARRRRRRGRSSGAALTSLASESAENAPLGRPALLHRNADARLQYANPWSTAPVRSRPSAGAGSISLRAPPRSAISCLTGPTTTACARFFR